MLRTRLALWARLGVLNGLGLRPSVLCTQVLRTRLALWARLGVLNGLGLRPSVLCTQVLRTNLNGLALRASFYSLVGLRF